MMFSACFEPGPFEVKANVVGTDAFFDVFKEYFLVLLFE